MIGNGRYIPALIPKRREPPEPEPEPAPPPARRARRLFITVAERARREDEKIRLAEPIATRPRGNPLLALEVIERWQRDL